MKREFVTDACHPAVPDSAIVPDVEEQPAGPAGPPPRTRPDRSHLTIVFAALAVSRRIENQTGWTIRKFVGTARRYRTIQIQAGPRCARAS